jgi:hypothetical protein
VQTRRKLIGGLTNKQKAEYEAQVQRAKLMTDADREREKLTTEMESLFGVDATNQMIDFALAELGGGANFQQQIEAIKNEFNRQLEESTKPTSGGGQPSETATEGGATAGEGTVTQNEAETGEVNAVQTEGQEAPQEVTPVVESAPAATDVVEPETKTAGDGQEATTEIAEAEVTPEEGRSYHIVAINEKTGDKTYLTKEPLQHSKAVAMKNKFSSNPARRVQLEDVTGGGYTRARSSLNKTSSWVIRDKNTGDLMMETFDQKKVENLNTDKYEAVPILEYLQELNAKSKAETATTPQQESEFADLASKIAGSNLIIKCNL